MNKKKQYTKHKDSGVCIGDILVIAAVSAAAGFAAGIFLAPRSGTKTRKMLDAAIRETIDRFKFLMLEARVMSEEIMEKGREKAGSISSKVKSKK